MTVEEDFDPSQVAKIIAEALQERSILPISFVETSLFSRLSSLLSHYMNPSDVVWVISELRNEFFSGFTSITTKKLHDVVLNCVKCVDVFRPPVLPSWNTADPDLMIIAENPISVGKHSTFLTAALKEAGFSSQRCMLTYVTRCGAKPLTSDSIKNCLPYLHTEMAIVNPKLILTLGLSSYVAVCGNKDAKLNEIKGSIFWFGPFPILPEASLAAGVFAREKSQSMQSYLASSLTTAHAFLYGGSN